MTDTARGYLYADHAPLVVAIARGLARTLPRSIDVEDLAQIGRIALWQACAGADPERAATFGVYVRQRIRGAMLDAVRGKAYHEALREATAERLDTGQPVPTITNDSHADPFVARAVAALPARQRIVLTSRFAAGMSHAETAAALGVSHGTTRRDEALAIGKLRTRLAACGLKAIETRAADQ
jgi:RNA polymerase sigma factor (sigma-70 family)